MLSQCDKSVAIRQKNGKIVEIQDDFSEFRGVIRDNPIF